MLRPLGRQARHQRACQASRVLPCRQQEETQGHIQSLWEMARALLCAEATQTAADSLEGTLQLAMLLLGQRESSTSVVSSR